MTTQMQRQAGMPSDFGTTPVAGGAKPGGILGVLSPYMRGWVTANDLRTTCTQQGLPYGSTFRTGLDRLRALLCPREGARPGHHRLLDRNAALSRVRHLSTVMSLLRSHMYVLTLPLDPIFRCFSSAWSISSSRMSRSPVITSKRHSPSAKRTLSFSTSLASSHSPTASEWSQLSSSTFSGFVDRFVSPFSFLGAVAYFEQALQASEDMQGIPTTWAATHLNLGHALRKAK